MHTRSLLYGTFQQKSKENDNSMTCPNRNEHVSEMHLLAMLYHVWDMVRGYTSASFHPSVQPRVVLQSCAYLLNTVSPNSAPHGIEYSSLIETFVDIAKSLNAFHSARVAYDRYDGHTDEMAIDMLELEVGFNF